MITRKSPIFKTLLKFQHSIRLLEASLFVTYIIAICWTIFQNWMCKAQFCDLNVNRVDIGIVIMIGFIISGIINSVRLLLVYQINDRDPRPERWFYFALVLMALTYSIFGFYFYADINDYIQYGQNTIVYTILALSLFTSTAIFLTDKQTWHKNSYFVQTRVTLCIINQIILFISPSIGFFTTMLLLPAFIVINGKPNKVDEVI
jgi:uncharacterized membrane protein HdeD (DUF308 family)